MTDSRNPELALRQLWFASNDFYKNAQAAGQLNDSGSLPYAETPGGLEIRKAGSCLQLTAECIRFMGDDICQVTVEVDYSPTCTDEATVREDWMNATGAGTATVAKQEFPRITDELMVLFDPALSESRIA